MSFAVARTDEGKYLTSADSKKHAAEIYSHWYPAPSDGIDAFLVKSADTGGLPFSMAPEVPAYATVVKRAYKAPLNTDGIAVLPLDWADDE